MHTYEVELQRVTEEFERLIFDEKGWKLRKSDGRYDVYSTKTPSSTKSSCFKCVGLVKLSPERIMDTVNPFGPYRPQFDSDFVSAEVLEIIDKSTVIGYHVTRPRVLGISLTGDCVLMHHMDQKEFYHYTTYSSIKYNIEKSAGIRGWLYPSGFAAFKTEDPDVTKAVTFWQVDCPLPGFLSDLLLEKSTMDSMIKYLTCLETMEKLPYEPLSSHFPLSRKL